MPCRGANDPASASSSGVASGASSGHTSMGPSAAVWVLKRPSKAGIRSDRHPLDAGIGIGDPTDRARRSRSRSDWIVPVSGLDQVPGTAELAPSGSFRRKPVVQLGPIASFSAEWLGRSAPCLGSSAEKEAEPFQRPKPFRSTNDVESSTERLIGPIGPGSGETKTG